MVLLCLSCSLLPSYTQTEPDGWTDSASGDWGGGNKCPSACLADCQIVKTENVALSSV